MKVKYLFVYLFFLVAIHIMAQKQANIWYFGINAGLDFNFSPPKVLTDGKLAVAEGGTSIADENGNLLFYTDGLKVWNKDHQLMENGDSIITRPLSLDLSTTQSCIIVRQPCENNIYYIFTANGHTSNFVIDGPVYLTNLPFSYTIVDMSYNAGKGKVLVKNQFLFSPTQEKIAAAMHSNGKDVWIMARKAYSSSFYAYLLTNTGITGPFISNAVAASKRDSTEGIGQMKISSDGKKLVSVITTKALPGKPGSIELFDFDNSTGQVSSPVVIPGGNAYGVEFSPDNSKIYYTSYYPSSLFQYNISSGIKQSILNAPWAYSLQLAPDNKIYVAQNAPYSQYIGVINNPNASGTACEYMPTGIFLKGKLNALGLPNFISGFNKNFFPKADFTFSKTCVGDTTIFTDNSINTSQWKWRFGDVLSTMDSSSNQNGSYVYPAVGIYTVTLVVSDGCNSDSISKEVTINPLPMLNLGRDTAICVGHELVLNGSTATSYLWSTGNNNSSININQLGTYWLKVENEFGCLTTDSIEIYEQTEGCDSYAYIPDVFTPDGNGVNDIFLPVFYNPVEEYQMNIYDRWGNNVYHSASINNGWNGNNAMNGTYVYDIMFTSNGLKQKRIGRVALIK